MVRRKLVIVAAIVLAGLAGRAGWLVHQTGRLFGVSHQFPRDYWVGREADPAAVLVLMGDSTVEGTGVPRVEETLGYQVADRIATREHRRVHVMNLAHSGARIGDVLDTQWSGVPALHPQFVLVNVGANDATHFSDLGRFSTALADLHARLASLSDARIAVGNSPDMRLVPALFPLLNHVIGRRADAQNEVIASLLPPADPIRIADLFGRGKLGAGQFASDGFHPNADGYRLWARLFFPDDAR